MAFDANAFLAELRGHARKRRFGDLVSLVSEIGDAPAEEIVRALGTGAEAHQSVPASLHAFLRFRTSFADIVLFAISLGGDAESLGG